MRKQCFMASLCWYGAQGGALKADDRGVIFAAQKLTLPDNLKKIKMPYSSIKLAVCRCALGFPAVEITLGGGKEYKFIVFGRERFLKILECHGVRVLRSSDIIGKFKRNG